MLNASLNFELSCCCHSNGHLEWENAVNVLGVWGSGSSHKNICLHVRTLLWSCVKGAKQAVYIRSEGGTAGMGRGEAWWRLELFVPWCTCKELSTKLRWAWVVTGISFVSSRSHSLGQDKACLLLPSWDKSLQKQEKFAFSGLFSLKITIAASSLTGNAFQQSTPTVYTSLFARAQAEKSQ